MNPVDSILLPNTAVVFDVDGTLKHPRATSNEYYRKDPTHPAHMRYATDFLLYPGVKEALKRLSCDVSIFAASNQGGLSTQRKVEVDGEPVYRPIKSLDWVEAEMLELMSLLPHGTERGSAISSVFFVPGKDAHVCYELEKHNRAMRCWTERGINSIRRRVISSDFYKPGHGMLEAITCIHSGAYGFDRLVYVGDRPADELCAKSARAAGLNVDFVWATDWHKEIA